FVSRARNSAGLARKPSSERASNCGSRALIGATLALKLFNRLSLELPKILVARTPRETMVAEPHCLALNTRSANSGTACQSAIPAAVAFLAGYFRNDLKGSVLLLMPSRNNEARLRCQREAGRGAAAGTSLRTAPFSAQAAWIRKSDFCQLFL